MNTSTEIDYSCEMDNTVTTTPETKGRERGLRRAARIMSWLLHPAIIPLLVFTVLFVFTYLRILPNAYKLIVLGIIACFTIVTPAIAIYVYRRLHKISITDISNLRHRRFIPFLMTAMCYFVCLQLMYKLMLPWYMTGVIVAALIIQIICMIANFWWKLSEHMAGMGAIIGGLVAFGTLFGYNPLMCLSFAILISGAMGSSRMILRFHSLGQVLASFVVGFVSTIFVLNPQYNSVLRFLLEAGS